MRISPCSTSMIALAVTKKGLPKINWNFSMPSISITTILIGSVNSRPWSSLSTTPSAFLLQPSAMLTFISHGLSSNPPIFLKKRKWRHIFTCSPHYKKKSILRHELCDPCSELLQNILLRLLVRLVGSTVAGFFAFFSNAL